MSFVSLSDDVASCFRVTAADGAVLPVYRLHDGPPPGAPVLLWGHATGLAAGSYLHFFRRLTSDVRIYAFDARGHGGASWPDEPLTELVAPGRFVDDLKRIGMAVTEHAGAVPHYAGHSLGGTAALRLELRGDPLPWPSLTMFEPPVFPPLGDPDHAEADEKQNRLVRRTERRQAAWPDRETMVAFLKGRGIFTAFDDASLAQHVAATLRPDGQGGFVLCCPPLLEAANFRNLLEQQAWPRLGEITRPVVLVRGDPASPDRDWITGASEAIAARMADTRLVTLTGAGHMMMFDQPDTCAAILRQQLGLAA